MAQKRQHQWTSGKLDALLKVANCFAIHALLLVGEAAITKRREGVGIKLQDFGALLDCPIVLARQVKDPAQVRTGSKRKRFEFLRSA